MKSMILAAGFGTRMKPLSDKTPKPLIPVLGVPMMFFPIDLLTRIGTTEFITNAHHMIEDFKDGLEDAKKFKKLSIDISIEKDVILGTGGGIKKVESFFKDQKEFFVSTSDWLFIPDNQDDFFQIIESTKDSEELATLFVTQHPLLLEDYGAVFTNSSNELVAFGKSKKNSDLVAHHFIGLQRISNRVFDYISEGPCDIFRDVYLKAIKNSEKVKVISVDGKWYDFGELQKYNQAINDIKKNIDSPNFGFVKDLISTFSNNNT